jgi:hypothetical protein
MCFKIKIMELTKEQKQEWEQWLSERPENVRKVAERIVPWKKYRDTRITDDIGNRYSPRSYEEQEDGSVTVTCEKSNEEMPFFGGYGVFGMNPDNLIEAE